MTYQARVGQAAQTTSYLRWNIPSGLIAALGALLICILNIRISDNRVVLLTVVGLAALLGIMFILGKTDTILLALFAYTPFSLRLNLTASFSLPSDLLLFDLFLVLLVIRSALKQRWHFHLDSIISSLAGFIFIVTMLAFMSTFAGVGDLGQDTRKIFYLIHYLIVFFIVTNLIDSPKQVVKSIKTLITVGAVIAFITTIIVIPQFISNFDIWAFREWIPNHIVRLLHGEKAAEAAYTVNNWVTFVGGRAILRTFLPFINPMALAQYLLIVFPVTVSLVVYLRIIRERIYLRVCLVVIGIAILLSFSRGVWLGTAIALGVFFVEKRMIKRFLSGLQRGRIPKWFLGICFTAFIVFLIVIVVPLFRDRLFSIFDFSNESNIDRFITWKTAWSNFVRSPIIGRGLGYAEKYYAHNTYLDLAVQTGIIGVSSFVFIFLSAITKLNFIRKYSSNAFFSQVALGWVGTIFGLLVHFFFDNELLFPQNGVPLVTMLALITVLLRITKRELHAHRN